MKIIAITFCGTWILCVCLGQTSGAPASWDSPCGSSHSIGKTASISIPLSFKYESLIENADLFTRAATNLKTIYEGTDRVTGDRLIQKLQYFDMPGLNLPQNITNKTQDPSGDYEYLSRLKVYLGHVLQDENNNRSSECAPAIKYLIKHATDILCNLKNIQKDVNLTTVSSTVEDVMPEELKSLKSSSLMFMRDYVIFHKAENFGRLLKQKYFELFLDSTQRT